MDFKHLRKLKVYVYSQQHNESNNGTDFQMSNKVYENTRLNITLVCICTEIISQTERFSRSQSILLSSLLYCHWTGNSKMKFCSNTFAQDIHEHSELKKRWHENSHVCCFEAIKKWMLPLHLILQDFITGFVRDLHDFSVFSIKIH